MADEDHLVTWPERPRRNIDFMQLHNENRRRHRYMLLYNKQLKKHKLDQLGRASMSAQERAKACATAENYKIVIRDVEAINERADALRDKVNCWQERRRNRRSSSSTSSSASSWRHVNKVTDFFDSIKFSSRVASEVEELMSEYQRIVFPAAGNAAAAAAYSDEGATHPADLQLTKTSVDIVGRDQDVVNIIRLIYQLRQEVEDDDDEHNLLLNVIAIVGMWGIGKTTVAQMVYDQMEDSFDLRIWVHAFPYLDHKLVLRRMAEAVNSLQNRNYSEDELVDILKEKLSGRKYLLVLDDFWQSFRIFNTLKRRLLQLSSARGTVIVTAPREVAAADINIRKASFRRYKLGGLSDNDCWQLFCRSLSKENLELLLQQQQHHEEEEAELRIGNFLGEKCCGLPLAARELAKRFEDRTLTLQHLDSSALGTLCGSFSLSYELLSIGQRNCFRLCSLFPGDHNYDRVQLEDIWIAQHYDPFLFGDLFRKTFHFDELLSQFFFQKFEDSTDNKVTYKVDQLMHQLAVCRGSSQMMRMDTKEQSVDHPQRYLHLSLIVDSEVSTFPKVIFSMKKLKTLILLRETQMVHRCKISVIPPKLLARLKNLCVLDLQYAMIKKLPHTVGNLLNLRYLNLSETDISTIPESIGRLGSLTFLKLVNCRYLRKLNDAVANLVYLRKLDLSGCLFLVHVPNKIVNMENLMCLNIKDCSSLIRMPCGGVGQSIHLHTLPRYIVGENDGLTITELQALGQLEGELRVENLEKVAADEAPNANLWYKTKLKSLTLQWKWWNHADEEKDIETIQRVLDGLRPNKDLIKLEIISYIGKKFPFWLHRTKPDLTSLEEIKLFNLKGCEKLPPLGALPRLRVAEISGMDSVINVDAEFYGDNGTFPLLQKLTFSQMPKLEKWLAINRSNMFPCLTNLTIINCPELVALEMELPSVTELTMWLNNEGLYSSEGGLKGLTGSLKKVSISLCDKLLESSECKGLQELQALEEMEISGCQELTNLPRGVRRLHSIKSLTILCCNKLKVSPNLWNDELTSLHSLSIDGEHFTKSELRRQPNLHV